jgi:hypothetical protein
MPSDADVLALYRAGVDAVSRAVDGWTREQWARPACGVWDGTQLAGHLVTVIGWYHSWLDRALAGDASPAFPIGELDARTVGALAALPDGTGPERVQTFVAEARRYEVRVAEQWDVPFGYPRGTVTAGLHSGVAAVEWHVHAWDLTRAAGGHYEPDDAEALFAAAARCQLAAAGGIRAAVGGRVVGLAARGRPWHELLHRMGRA